MFAATTACIAAYAWGRFEKAKGVISWFSFFVAIGSAIVAFLCAIISIIRFVKWVWST